MIVEFAGLPNSGKSSAIAVAGDYFSRSAHRVKVVAEGARTCPFRNRHRVEFACWTASHAVGLVLEAGLGTDWETIMIQDRGVFDALAFLKLLHLEEFIALEKLGHFMDYFADHRWTHFVDLVLLFRVSPERAVERDYASEIGARPGVITNIATMRRLSVAYDFVLEEYGNSFPRVEQIDTTDATQLRTARKVVEHIRGVYRSGGTDCPVDQERLTT